MGKKLDKKLVAKAAEELNEILGLDPAIDLDQETDVLIEEVLEAADLLEEGDEISAQTVEVINAIKNAKVNPPEREPEDEPEDAGDEDAGDEDAGDEDAGDEDEPQSEEKSSEKKTKPKSKSGKTSGGVIATIASLIANSGEKGIGKEEILEELVKIFPDRNPKSMRNTINVQVPNRINKEKFPLEKVDNRFRKKA